MKNDKFGGPDEINEPNPTELVSSFITYVVLGNG